LPLVDNLSVDDAKITRSSKAVKRDSHSPRIDSINVPPRVLLLSFSDFGVEKTCGAWTIDAIMPKDFLLPSDHRMIVRESYDFEPCAASFLKEQPGAGWPKPPFTLCSSTVSTPSVSVAALLTAAWSSGLNLIVNISV
jgi:hypothetical protein